MSDDPIAHLEAVLARYSTQGSPSTVPTALDYERPARDPATGEIVPRPAAPARGTEEHLRDLTYTSIALAAELRRARGRIAALEDRVGRLWALADDEAREADRADAVILAQGRLIAVLALAVGGAYGLGALALGAWFGLWWSL